MATGTLTDSLNILAGVSGKTDVEAANLWAGIAKPYMELVGALNRKAGNTLPNYKELAGVCNQLAGTTGLEAVDALSRIAGGLGMEIGYASNTSNFTHTAVATFTNVTSLTLTFATGSRPVQIVFGTVGISASGATNTLQAGAISNGSNQIAQGNYSYSASAAPQFPVYVAARIPANTASATYTAQVYQSVAGTQTVVGTANTPSFLWAYEV